MTWTSAKLTVLEDQESIKVEVKDDIITEVKDTVERMRSTNTIPLKELRTLAGQATCIASLLHVWRPSVAMIWAPLYCHKARCPWDAEKVWTSAVAIALGWMSAFLRGVRGSLMRIYRLADDLGEAFKWKSQ